MGIVKCVVPGCEDRRSPRHRFPVFDQELYEEWLKRIGNVELLNLDPKYVGSNKRICSVHFSSHCRVPNSTKLKNRSLPTLKLAEFKEKPSEDNSILKYSRRTQTLVKTEHRRFEEVNSFPGDVKPLMTRAIDQTQPIDQINSQVNLIELDDDEVGFCQPVAIDFTYLMKITSLPDTPLIEESITSRPTSPKSYYEQKLEEDPRPSSNPIHGTISEAPACGNLISFDLDELIRERYMDHLAGSSSHLVHST